MPRPPRHDGLDELKFVTNYFLQGCVPPMQLVVDFSQEPGTDLLCLILAPDLEDIAQEILDPKKGRKRKPGRHGRKRNRKVGIPDTSELIGQKARGVINPGNVLAGTPLRRIFPILNAYEGINFTAAVLDGITDVGYETLWGILDVQSTHCYEFARLARHNSNEQFSGGVGPIPEPVNCDVVDFGANFLSSDYTATCVGSDWQLSFAMEVENPSEVAIVEMSACIQRLGGGKRIESYKATIPPKGSASLNVAQSFDAGETGVWGLGSRVGFVNVKKASVLAWGKAGYPLPW